MYFKTLSKGSLFLDMTWFHNYFTLIIWHPCFCPFSTYFLLSANSFFVLFSSRKESTQETLKQQGPYSLHPSEIPLNRKQYFRIGILFVKHLFCSFYIYALSFSCSCKDKQWKRSKSKSSCNSYYGKTGFVKR